MFINFPFKKENRRKNFRICSESVSRYEKGRNSKLSKTELGMNKVDLKWITFTETIKCDSSKFVTSSRKTTVLALVRFINFYGYI